MACLNSWLNSSAYFSNSLDFLGGGSLGRVDFIGNEGGEAEIEEDEEVDGCVVGHIRPAVWH